MSVKPECRGSTDDILALQIVSFNVLVETYSLIIEKITG